MMDNYLTILQESLEKKIVILDSLYQYCEQQENLLKREKLSLEEYDSIVDEKDKLIEQLTKLDEGFETVYGHVKDQLLNNKEMYKPQISIIQKLIATITEKSMSIQSKEARNKVLVEQHFKNIRQSMHANVKSTKAAYNYYKNTNNMGYETSQFMDQKK